MLKLVAGVLVMVVVAQVVADPYHHHHRYNRRYGSGGYGRRPTYGRPSYHDDRYGSHGSGGYGYHKVPGSYTPGRPHIPGTHQSPSIPSPGGFPDPSSSPNFGRPHSPVSPHNPDPHNIDGVDVRVEVLGFDPLHYPGLLRGHEFHDTEPEVGFSGCPSWCHSKQTSKYYCCEKTKLV